MVCTRLSYRLMFAAAGVVVFGAPTVAQSPSVGDEFMVAATAPKSRTVQVDATATVFATVQNPSGNPYANCSVALADPSLPVQLSRGLVNQDNVRTAGPSNEPFGISARGRQGLVLALTPTAPVASNEAEIIDECDYRLSANKTFKYQSRIIPGVNTVLLTAIETASPDIIPIALTQTGDGVITIAEAGGTVLMVAAAVNIGAAHPAVRVSAGPGLANLAGELFVCDATGQPGGACAQPPASSITVGFGALEVRTFSVFLAASGEGAIPNMPDIARVFLRFTEGDAPAQIASKSALAAPPSPVGPNRAPAPPAPRRP